MWHGWLTALARTATLGLAVVLATSMATADDEADELLRRAHKAFNRSRYVQPETVRVRGIGEDPATGVECRREAIITFRGKTASGDPDLDVVFTEELIGDVPSGEVDCHYFSDVKRPMRLPALPCAPVQTDEPRIISYEKTNEQREVGGTSCVVYGFEWKKRSCLGKGIVVGELCIDPVTGNLAELRYSPQRPPKGYRSVNGVVEYEDLGELGALPVRFTIEAVPKYHKGDGEPFRVTGKMTGHVRPRSE